VVGEHATAALVMLAPATVPDPFETVQVSFAGCAATVTAYAEPSARAVANVNEPSAPSVRSSAPSSCSTTVPESPEIVPPTV
jgi:hypothetical protein